MSQQDVQIDEKILTTLEAILAHLQGMTIPPPQPPPPPPPDLQVITQILQSVQQTLQFMQQTLVTQNTTLGLIASRLYVVDVDLEPTPIAGTVVVSQITT